MSNIFFLLLSLLLFACYLFIWCFGIIRSVFFSLSTSSSLSFFCVGCSNETAHMINIEECFQFFFRVFPKLQIDQKIMVKKSASETIAKSFSARSVGRFEQRKRKKLQIFSLCIDVRTRVVILICDNKLMPNALNCVYVCFINFNGRWRLRFFSVAFCVVAFVIFV